MKKLVLFDIDQTLITSGGAGSRALFQAFEKLLGISMPQLKSANIRMSGKTDPQIVQEIILACCKDQVSLEQLPDTIKAILDLYVQYLPQLIANTTNFNLHEGVNEILTHLQQNEQIALGLLTGNIEKGARMKLERVNLNGFFPIGAYGSDSGQST